MELIAKKNFRMGNRRIARGECFSCDNALGRIYLALKNAEYPPRILTPAPAPVAEAVRTPMYETRVMTANVDSPIVPRRRGRPRKKVEE